ncbi:hypothetical protein SAMN05192583_0815 [Sphingomonas gellani]|uniref:Uncharacterized protein n=1 Tax=Sphingomonas gellani TaxID=1166340 RepID=A0A1H7ZRZ2_9SPHN|nr:hypothetical protein [Sphingomonas gellani]SEM61036.1 hypothetical protein SAMN05192583_0815 [Sphingomonas gellani]
MSENADQARTRRRWVTLAELVAVAGVVIAGLGAWNSWSERRDAAADKAATVAAATKADARVDLSATVQDGGRQLLLKDDRHELQSITIDFPHALGATRQEPVADPILDARPFQDKLLELTDGGSDSREGRLAVLVTTRWLDGDAQRQARDVYDVIWRTEGRVLRGRALRLEGLRLRRRGGDQAAIDRLWTHP